MFARTRRTRSLIRRFVSSGARLAIVAQLSVAFASIADAREGQAMGAHVEQGGTSTHYAHSDACAICQARSLHGLAVRAAEPIPTGAVSATAFSAIADRLVAAELFSPSKSRAPPSRR